jgi:hypothetical protein
MKKIIIATFVVLLMSGCSSIPLEPQAKRVIVSTNSPSKDCKYIGQVVGNQGNFFTGGYTPNKNLEMGAMNDLKNQASKIGANYIELVTTRAGMGSNMTQTNVTNLGNAYSCPK